MGKITYVYEEARVLFWLLNRRFAHSLMCVILAEEDQKLVSFLFILEWEKKKPHHAFMTVVNIFFYIIDAFSNDKKASWQRRWKQLFRLYIFFCDDYCFMNWTVSRISHLMMMILIFFFFFLTTINFLLALHQACDHHPRNMSKKFCIIINLTNENCFLFMAWDYRNRLSSYKNLMRIRVHSHELTLIITHDSLLKSHNKHY